MDLEELRAKLYKEKQEELAGRVIGPSVSGPGQNEEAGESLPTDWRQERETPLTSPRLSQSVKRIIKIALVVLVVLGLVGAGVWFLFFRKTFDSSKVSLTIFGRDRIVSGEEVTYLVRYQNGTSLGLQGLKLTFFYPEGALPADKNAVAIGVNQASVAELSDLPAGQEGQMELRANIAGLKGDEKKALAKLQYHPADISSTFESSADFTSVIFSVPLVLDFEMPERVVSGQPLTISLKYLNTSDIAFSNLLLTAEYPAGFSFVSASPSASQGSNEWNLLEIGPGEEGKIIISGTLSGLRDEIKSFKAKIEQQEGDVKKTISEGLASTLISLSPLAVEVSLNGSRDISVSPGDTLTYKLKYQNTTNVQIGPVFIVAKFETKALDFSTIEPGKGSFNSQNNSITWNESVMPELSMLEPGQEETVDFRVKVKDRLPISSFSDKNFLISLSSKIDSPTIPVFLQGTQIGGSDLLATKVNTKLVLAVKGYYRDNIIVNSGPIPPKVGQQTTYTVHWQVINLANDAQNVTVEGYLPPYVKWLGVFTPNSSDAKYEQSTGKLSWALGKLAANTGILSPVKELVFQIALVPNSNQVGDRVDLVQNSRISGTDLFSGISLEGTAAVLQSDLPDDPSVGYNGGRITQ